MNISKRWLWLLIVSLASVGMLATIAACQEEHKENPWFQVVPPEYSDLSQKVMTLQKQGRFDDAVQLLEHSLRGQSSDDVLLRMIAYTHFGHAQADTPEREKWAKLGVQFSEKALQANPKDVVNLYNLGESYLLAGEDLVDVSQSESCRYYQESIDVFEKVAANPVMAKERALIEGEIHRMAPWRDRLNERLSKAKEAYSKCLKSGVAPTH